MSDTIPPTHDLLGTLPAERERLLRLNQRINPLCLARLRLVGGEKILDVGSGLGVFARDLARTAGGQVVCVERDDEQIERCETLAAAVRETALLDVRWGDAHDLPLAAAEWGTFDVVHARFLLQQVADPQRIVAAMARAVRPGGRLVLTDEDHASVVLWPALPAFDELWRALIQAYRSAGNDPFVGRRLTALMALADLQPVRVDGLFQGGCAGEPQWPVVVENLIGTLLATRADILQSSAITDGLFDEVLIGLREWSVRRDAAVRTQLCWAEAIKPRS